MSANHNDVCHDEWRELYRSMHACNGRSLHLAGPPWCLSTMW